MTAPETTNIVLPFDVSGEKRNLSLVLYEVTNTSCLDISDVVRANDYYSKDSNAASALDYKSRRVAMYELVSPGKFVGG